MKTPPAVNPQEWEAARQRLLVKEKEVTRARDALAAERRRMPWLAVEKDYEFDGPAGRVSLAGLLSAKPLQSDVDDVEVLGEQRLHDMTFLRSAITMADQAAASALDDATSTPAA
jgi:Bacterial protein of unknown function (DUF899)